MSCFRKGRIPACATDGGRYPTLGKIGKNVNFTHNAVGVVIHNSTVIEDDVKIYHGVTIGRAER